mgnify:CR=1 FL=1
MIRVNPCIPGGGHVGHCEAFIWAGLVVNSKTSQACCRDVTLAPGRVRLGGMAEVSACRHSTSVYIATCAGR